MIEFKPIPSCPGYEISSCGVVKSSRKILKPYLNNNGYLSFNISTGGAGKSAKKFIHVKVAEAWGLKGEGDCVNHIDHNRLNNNLSNLERCTRKENYYAAVTFYGKHLRQKYNQEHFDLIFKFKAQGFSHAKIAQELGCSRSTVTRILGSYKA
jgi:hypothetical protein